MIVETSCSCHVNFASFSCKPFICLPWYPSLTISLKDVRVSGSSHSILPDTDVELSTQATKNNKDIMLVMTFKNLSNEPRTVTCKITAKVQYYTGATRTQFSSVTHEVALQSLECKSDNDSQTIVKHNENSLVYQKKLQYVLFFTTSLCFHWNVFITGLLVYVKNQGWVIKGVIYEMKLLRLAVYYIAKQEVITVTEDKYKNIIIGQSFLCFLVYGVISETTMSLTAMETIYLKAPPLHLEVHTYNHTVFMSCII